MTGTPRGELRLVGRLVEASNGTFLAEDDDGERWVYKPVAGEAPLWDFPPATLGRREVAAYALSEHLGLGSVPETVWREGPLGEGAVGQAWIDGEPSDLVGLLRPEEITEARLPRVAGTTEDGATVVLAHRDDPRLGAAWRCSTRSSTTPTARVLISSPTANACGASTTA